LIQSWLLQKTDRDDLLHLRVIGPEDHILLKTKEAEEGVIAARDLPTKKDRESNMNIKAVVAGVDLLEAVVDPDIVAVDIATQIVIKAEEDGPNLFLLQILTLVLPTVNTKERKDETIRSTRKIKNIKNQR
jgi:hypothetical protein